jgi:hypothetical protein
MNTLREIIFSFHTSTNSCLLKKPILNTAGDTVECNCAAKFGLPRGGNSGATFTFQTFVYSAVFAFC